MALRIWMVLALIGFAADIAHAQSYSVQQSGPVVPGHIVCFSMTGTVYDCGPGGGALAVGQTSIIGGINGGFLYDNNGVLGTQSLSTLLSSAFNAPPPIGSVTPNTGSFTAITAQTSATNVSLITTLGSVSIPPTGQQTLIVRQTAPNTVSIILPASAYYPLCPAFACPQFTIKDGAGVAASDNITILAADGKTIDGKSSLVMPVNFESVTVVLDGAQWNAI